MNTIKLKKNALFNPEGDTDLRHRRMIGGNTTNLNDFNTFGFPKKSISPKTPRIILTWTRQNAPPMIKS